MILLITIYILAVSMLFILIKLFISKTIWDRLLALNIISSQSLMFLIVLSVYKNSEMLLDISLIYGITGFIGLSLFSRFILKGGRQK
ncbi:MAG: monovalent cation/H+ antiporter complex subunit F [Bacillota bacterium]